MFSLDHHNNARCLPLHLTQMIDLKQMHQLLYKKFSNRKFAIQKANRKFSKNAVDQNHEQSTSAIKGGLERGRGGGAEGFFHVWLGGRGCCDHFWWGL